MTPMASIADRFRGRVVPAVPVPFSADGNIDVELQNAYVTWMARQEIGGVAVWAHTGRGPKLSDEQREQVARAWSAGLDGQALVCGVGVSGRVALPSDPASLTETALRAVKDSAEAARVCGAEAALVHPPKMLSDLPDVEERILDYHRAAGAAGIPLIAFFLYEAAGGVSYSPGLIRRLLELDEVIGIKVATLDSVMTYQDIIGVAKAVPGALPITGEDRFLGYSLAAGARAALIGMAAAVTDRCAALLNAHAAEQWDDFHALSSAMDTFSQATFVAPMEGYVQRMLWALEADGVFARSAFDPWCPTLHSDERDRVFAAVRALRS